MAPASTHGDHFAEVVLVRHGQTDWNVSRIIQGRIDQELNETGRQQAAKVARRLSEEAKPAAVYSSDLKRASQTAQTIAVHCCVSDSDLVIDRALTERHGGLFQGWTFDDAKRSEAYKVFARGGRDQEILGGGESLDQLSERLVPRLNAIAEKHKGERVVVVSHEAVIEEICRHADPTISVGRKIPNTSISVVHISGSDGRWILEKFGDAGHPIGDGFPQSTL
ncbi:phosphoglycerate mutase-like protein 4 [Setaria italica]|uniref:phosphoglycerate mutase-like protein 4 n=1 Tax=Setaria italica TaxID=4555 RepID=UPI000350E138|nr:phosphoglycerate mutase-like protein 4 [Setaria italica]